MKKWSTEKWFIIMVVLAFLSVGSFFQINSSWTDAADLNWLVTVTGVAFGLAAVYCLYRVSKQGGTPTS